MSIFSGVNNPGVALNQFTTAEQAALVQLGGLGDPNADRIVFWDDSAGSFTYLTVGSGLSISGTTITASATGVSGTINEIAYFDSGTSIASLAVATYPSLTELSYVKGVTSALQTQFNNKQPLDSDLTTLAGLTATTDNFIVSVASAWASRTPAQVRTTLALVIGTDVQAYDADLTTWAGITPAANVGTFLATPSSANLLAAITDETGTGALVFGTTPTITTPVLTGLPTGTGVASAATASTLASRDANANLTALSFLSGFTSTATAAGTTTLTIASTPIQVFTGVTTQTVKLPTTSVAAGQQFVIVNQSTGLVTVQSSGANTIVILGASTTGYFTAVIATPTTAANWSFDYSASKVTSGKVASFSNTLTFAGTDATTMTFPTTSATVARTDAANTFTGASTASAWVLTSPTITTKISPTTDDGAPLGDTTHNFSDLFLASGAVINWNNGDLTLTHAANLLTLAGGQWTFGANTAYFVETDNGNSGTTDTIDWTLSNKQKSTLTGNVTYTFTAPGGPCSLVLKLVQDATGTRTVTWPAAVHWSGGTAPTLTTTVNKVDIITFYYDGTTYFGNSSLNYTA